MSTGIPSLLAKSFTIVVIMEGSFSISLDVVLSNELEVVGTPVATELIRGTVDGIEIVDDSILISGGVVTSSMESVFITSETTSKTKQKNPLLTKMANTLSKKINCLQNPRKI